MNYDKNSFCAGIAVGRTLKGWASAGGGTGGPAYLLKPNKASWRAGNKTDMPDPIIGIATFVRYVPIT